MKAAKNLPGALLAVLIGALGLAAALGIGRFALTPLLPLMQQSFGLPLAGGGVLATANYIGYLFGALVSFAWNPAPGKAARLGLVAGALFTMATGMVHLFRIWLVLQFLAGVASAFVLINLPAWALFVLAQHRRLGLSGGVFAGVGFGMTLAGFVGLLAGVTQTLPDVAWLALGFCALLISAFVWKPLKQTPGPRSGSVTSQTRRFGLAEWRTILCYAAFGFGYIIPATFLPAFARQLINDPAVFGWVWPVFGMSAAVSTIVSGYFFGTIASRRVWAYSQIVMAIGALAPTLFPCLATILLSALCVGGTFMVLTMAALREAHLIAKVHAPRLIAAMTVTFAVGQLSGPLMLRPGPLRESIIVPGILAFFLLFASSIALLLYPGTSHPAGELL